MQDNTCRHPSDSVGTTQTDRLLKTLIPSNLKLDPRGTEDFLAYTVKFAKNIQFWKSEKTGYDTSRLVPDGDWTDFWESDHLFFLAQIASLDIEGTERKIRKAVFEVLTMAGTPESGNRCDPDQCAIAMRKLINLLFGLATLINESGEKAKAYPALSIDFQSAITPDLIRSLKLLIAFDKETGDEPNVYDAFIYDCSPYEFSHYWKLNKVDFMKIDWLDPCDEAYDSARKLERIAREFIRVTLRLREKARNYLGSEQNSDNRQHQPHIALFLAFLHLFRHLQEQLNGLTQSHLDHYYERILHLERKKQVPDQTHLVFQLAQGVVRHTIDTGTSFRARKDSSGKDLFYDLEKPLSLNKAKVTELKTLYVSHRADQTADAYYEATILDTDKNTPAPEKIEEILSFYSLGKGGDPNQLSTIGFAISSAEFINSKASRTIRVLMELDNFEKLLEEFRSQKDALAGFNNFLPRVNADGTENPEVAEVDRDVWFNNLRPKLANLLNLEISTTKGWIELDQTVAVNHEEPGDQFDLLPKDLGEKPVGADAREKAIDFVTVKEKNFLSIIIRLGKSVAATAIPPQNAGDLPAKWPVLKVSLKPEERFIDEKAYKLLCPTISKAIVSAIYVTTEVKDVTDFQIVAASSNVLFPSTKNIEISRYFDEGLILRVPELVMKRIWADGGLENYHINASLPGNDKKIRFGTILFQDGVAINSREGVPLERNFEKDRYLQITSRRRIIAEEDDEIVRMMAARPLAAAEVPQQDKPVYLDFSIDYVSFQCIFHAGDERNHPFKLRETDLSRLQQDDNLDQAYYLLPHQGYKELIHLHQVVKGAKQPFAILEPLTPPVTGSAAVDEQTEIIPNGNLFIGVRDLQALQTLSVLFQVVDGTEENYKLGTPDVEWSYLYKDPRTGTDGWKRFPSGAILSDTTKADTAGKKSLVQSGIVELAIPKDATTLSTILKPGYHWIRASALEARDEATQIQLTSVLSLPRLIGVHAQAGRVTLSTKGVSDDHFNQPIPEKTISALRQRQSSVQKVNQFYSGFGGRASEPDEHFYRRVSERLRHRGRAITAWDYERLALERFPEIRAAKCLQHTKTEIDNDTEKYNVCANGHLTLVVLPFVRNPEYQQPLAPLPSLALLENVKGYLRKRANLFVAAPGKNGTEYLHISRPAYEAVVVAIKVRFRPEGFADQETLMFRLDHDISSFIAPWAFDEKVAPRFGNTIYRTDLVCWLETLPYVDYIEELLIGIATRNKNQEVTFDFSSAGPGNPPKPHAILHPSAAGGILSAFTRLPDDTLDTAIANGGVPDDFLPFLPKDDYTPHHLIKVLS